jgi:hypothetical protein
MGGGVGRVGGGGGRVGRGGGRVGGGGGSMCVMEERGGGWKWAGC